MNSFFSLYDDQQDKKKELPDWYQQSALGQFAQQKQEAANRWFGDLTSGITEPIKQYTDPVQQYGDQLKEQGQQWFLQTPVGQGVNDFYTSLMKPSKQAADTANTSYQTKLGSLYSDYNRASEQLKNEAMKKLGLL